MRARVHSHSGARSFSTFSASWRHGLSGPEWSTAKITLLGVEPWDRPVPGRDWLTIEPNPVAPDFVGRITACPWGVGGPADEVSVDPISVDAAGFLETDNDVVTSPARSVALGSIFPSDTWFDEVVSPYIDEIQGAKLGRAMQSMVRAAYSSLVPGTIASGSPRLGDIIYVVYDDDTARAVGLKGSFEPVQGFSLQGVRSLMRTSSKPAHLIIGTFQPNDALIELTPMLVPISDLRASPPRQAIIGGRVLVARLRIAPFRVRPLSESVRERSPFTSPAPVVQQYGTAGRYEPGLFEIKTWDTATARRAPAYTRLEGARLGSLETNASTAWLANLSGGDALQLAEALELPVVDSERVIRDGPRLSSTTWPFFPPLGAQGVPEQDYLALALRVARTQLQFRAPGALFESGRAVLPTFDASWQPGTLVKFPYGGRDLTAYITEVAHTVDVEDGVVVGSTTLQFSRGLWDESLRDVVVYVDPPPPPAQATVVGGTACAIGCASPFPINLDEVDFSRVPARLGDWFLRVHTGSAARALTKRALEGDFGADVMKRMLVTAAAAFVVQRYWQQRERGAQVLVTDGYRADTGSDAANHRIGCAFDFGVYAGVPNSPALKNLPVFQTWAALYKLAKKGRIPYGGRGIYVNVSSSGVTGTSFTACGAASRVRGAAVDSAPNANVPRGASSGVHYDFRGYFGAHHILNAAGAPLLGALAANKWIATDRDGDGYDEATLGQKIHGGGRDYTAVWENIGDVALRNAITAYFNTGFSSDSWLPDVGPTVPNMMQVLNQTGDPNCFLDEIPV